MENKGARVPLWIVASFLLFFGVLFDGACDPLAVKPLRSMNDPFWSTSSAPRVGTIKGLVYSNPFSSEFCDRARLDSVEIDS